MKAEDLKKIIKPLIKECLREVLVEEGFTKMISEAAFKNAPVLEPSTPSTPPVFQRVRPPPPDLNEAKKKMLDTIGNNGFDPFVGTEPLREDKEVKGSDPGVDISSLMGNKDIWKSTLNAMNKKK